MNFKKSNFLFFTLLILSFLFAKNVLAAASYLCLMSDGSKTCQDITYFNNNPGKCVSSPSYNSLTDCLPHQTEQTIFWYPCSVAGIAKTFTCENTKGVNCGFSNKSKEACKQLVLSQGGIFQESAVGSPAASNTDLKKQQAAAQAAQEADAQQAAQDAEFKAQKDAVKKAQAEELLKAGGMVCDCSKNGGQCKDDFTLVQDAIDYCMSCGLPQPKEVSGAQGCPLGSKEIGPFHCSCGSGDKAVCSTYDTFTELNQKCAKSCGSANGPCPVIASVSLKKLQQDAKILNPAGFALGSAGITEIVGKIIIFLLFPIGMFTMVMYIWAGFLWMTAQGSSENIGKAKSILVWTTLGVVITLASYLIVQLVFTEIL